MTAINQCLSLQLVGLLLNLAVYYLHTRFCLNLKTLLYIMFYKIANKNFVNRYLYSKLFFYSFKPNLKKILAVKILCTILSWTTQQQKIQRSFHISTRHCCKAKLKSLIEGHMCKQKMALNVIDKGIYRDRNRVWSMFQNFLLCIHKLL